MFEDALRYPYDDGEGLRALAIGGLLAVLSFLLLPAIVVSGYTLRVLRQVDAGDEHLPSFADPVALFVDGLKAIAVALAYLVVPIVLVAFAAVALFVPVTGTPPTWLSAIAAIISVLSVPVFLLALYALPAGLVALARTDRMGAAFSRRELSPTLRSGSYLVAWLLALVVTLVAGFVGGAASATALVGWLLAAFVGFYANLVGAYLYARGVREARPVESGEEGVAGIVA
jgi:hypothetical protein